MPAGAVGPISREKAVSREKAAGSSFRHAVATLGTLHRHANNGPGADHHREAFISV